MKEHTLERPWWEVSAADLDGDGRPEIAVSRQNQIAGSGLAGGVVVYDRDGRKLWAAERTLRNFAFADWAPGGGQELVVGGPAVEFTVYDATGRARQKFEARGWLLEQFEVVTGPDTGSSRVIALYPAGNRFSLLAHDGQRVQWETPVMASLRSSGTGRGTGFPACSSAARVVQTYCRPLTPPAAASRRGRRAAAAERWRCRRW